MDPLTGNVCRLSRVEAYAVTSTAGRYMALFKAVLCACGNTAEGGSPFHDVSAEIHFKQHRRNDISFAGQLQAN